jgi:hypothetical protein
MPELFDAAPYKPTYGADLVCSLCGAQVADVDLHTAHHVGIGEVVEVLRRVASSLSPPTRPVSPDAAPGLVPRSC